MFPDSGTCRYFETARTSWVKPLVVGRWTGYSHGTPVFHGRLTPDSAYVPRTPTTLFALLVRPDILAAPYKIPTTRRLFDQVETSREGDWFTSTPIILTDCCHRA